MGLETHGPNLLSGNNRIGAFRGHRIQKKTGPEGAVLFSSELNADQIGTLRSISMPTSPAAISRSAVTPGLFFVSILGVALAQHARTVGGGQHQLEAVRDLGQAVFDGDAGHGAFLEKVADQGKIQRLKDGRAVCFFAEPRI
jgi:hypothetical protein